MESLRWLGAGAGQVLPWVTTGEGEGRGADQSPVRNLDAALTAPVQPTTRPRRKIAHSTMGHEAVRGAEWVPSRGFRRRAKPRLRRSPARPGDNSEFRADWR